MREGLEVGIRGKMREDWGFEVNGGGKFAPSFYLDLSRGLGFEVKRGSKFHSLKPQTPNP